MRVTGKTMGRQAVKLANDLVNLAVLVVLILLTAIASYAMWDSHQVYQAADANQYAIYKPTEDDTLSFEALQALNPEVISWLSVYGTHIDYPVTQSQDNRKYINTNARGEYALSGSIFLDYHNQPDYSDFNSILYGHHMDQQTMFGELDQFTDETFFNTHPYGNLFYNGQNHGLAFFAFLHVDAYDSAVFNPRVQGKEAQQAYLENLLTQAIHQRDRRITTDDHIVLLTTCSSTSTNGRDILVAQITDTAFADPFKDENNPDGNRTEATGLWQRLPTGVKITLPILLILIVLAIVFTIDQKRRKQKPPEKQNKTEIQK